MSRLAAVLLAAGFSSRMGEFKPLLPLVRADGGGDEPALARCVRTFREAGLTEILAVTGHRADELAPLLDELGVRRVPNPDYAKGMFGSVRTGVAALDEAAEGFFLLPVDIPLVRPATLRILAGDFREHHAPVTHPTFLGERGHPPLLARELIAPILAHDGAGGLRGLLDRCESRARDVAVADEAVLLDMDRPEDYARLRERAGRRGASDAECAALFAIAETTEPTRAHCRAVADAALRMARALNLHREARADAPPLDLDLTHGAALLHDVRKGQKHHDRAGAEFLRTYGFPELAEIVAAHTDLELADAAPLTEREIVFLADKFVQGTRIVPLAERYLAKRKRFQGDPEAVAAVESRLLRAERVLRRFCAESGVRLPELLEEDAQTTVQARGQLTERTMESAAKRERQP